MASFITIWINSRPTKSILLWNMSPINLPGIPLLIWREWTDALLAHVIYFCNDEWKMNDAWAISRSSFSYLAKNPIRLLSVRMRFSMKLSLSHAVRDSRWDETSQAFPMLCWYVYAELNWISNHRIAKRTRRWISHWQLLPFTWNLTLVWDDELSRDNRSHQL